MCISLACVLVAYICFDGFVQRNGWVSALCLLELDAARGVGVSHRYKMDDYAVRFVSQSTVDARCLFAWNNVLIHLMAPPFLDELR